MDLNTLSLSETTDGLKKRKFSSAELVLACIDRIKQTEPAIHACVTTCAEEAIQQAKAIHTPDDAVHARMPLLGVPVVVKDNYCTAGVRTTASSKVLDAYIPVHDATVWKKVRDAGAILIAKTNMDAWAHGSSTETSDYGASKNPWDTNTLPGGSSGGTAASIAADQAIIGLGSETAGSIRQPAAWCGIVGLKPTYGRASRSGIIAMGSSLDCPGPMTKTVSDAAHLLNIIAGHDPHDATSMKNPAKDYTAGLGGSIRGMTLGYCEDYFNGVEPGVASAVHTAFKKLESLGAVIKKIDLFDPSYAIAVYTIIQRGEVSSNLARYDGIRYGNDRSFFGQEAKRRIMLGTYVLSSGYYDAYYNKAEKVRTVIMQDFDRAFQSVDAIIAPTSPSCALPVGSSKNHPMFGEMADVLVEPSSIAGLPGISVPCGFAGSLPVGLQIIGPQCAEERIITIAHAYEQATDWHTMKPKNL